jgi:hypothetical protein
MMQYLEACFHLNMLTEQAAMFADLLRNNNTLQGWKYFPLDFSQSAQAVELLFL